MSDTKGLAAYWLELEGRYDQLLREHLGLGAPLRDVAIHSLQGGKRLRPLLAELLGEAAGAPREAITDVAIAVEYLHTASVLLDDLPCMDDSPTRRGAPAAHRCFSEAEVILTAVALTSRSSALLIGGAGRPPEVGRAMALLACDTVAGAMALGQAIELGSDDAVSEDGVRSIHERKTGSLFALIAKLVVAAAGASASAGEALVRFVVLFGRAYQVVDDVEDEHVRGEARANLATVVGHAGAVAEARQLLVDARRAIAEVDPADQLLACVAWLEAKLDGLP